MSDALSLADFLHPVDPHQLSHDEGYREGQIGHYVQMYTEEIPDLEDVDIVIVGCGEQRGAGVEMLSEAPDVIRHQFYSLYYWHQEIRMADLGDIRTGSTLQDTYAAIRTVVSELIGIGKMVILLGGSNDLALGQYEAFRSMNKIIEVTGIDSLIDIHMESPFRQHHFLMEMLTGEPNFIRHYNHLAFQSYYVNPLLLETMDKLRFDCYRVGMVKEHMDEMEPVVRNSHMVMFDVNAIRHSDAPSNYLSPNGLSGEEACIITRNVGMSTHANTFGIFGYNVQHDSQLLTARQISQMLWYLLDGKAKGKQDAPLSERDSYFEFHTAFGEVDTVFLQSKRTGRWWMQLPDHTFIACSYNDYLQASSNEIPERYLRALERN